MVRVGVGRPADGLRRPTRRGFGARLACVAAALMVLNACGSSNTATTTTTTTDAVASSASGAGSGGQGAGGAGSAPSSLPPVTTAPPTTPPPTTEPPTTVPSPTYYGSYSVKQIVSLGGETISGSVCDVRQPFQVGAVAPRAAWSFMFVPDGAQDGHTGALSYAYEIPSAGESHVATGTYTLSDSDPDGIRHVALKVSDHVVFKGFDGNIPVSYNFDLVPTQACAAGA